MASKTNPERRLARWLFRAGGPHYGRCQWQQLAPHNQKPYVEDARRLIEAGLDVDRLMTDDRPRGKYG